MYTTDKKIGKLSNQLIFSWVVIGFALVKLAFKDYNSFDSFKAIGNFFDVILMLGIGIAGFIYANKHIKRIKGLEFDINASEFIYKSADEVLKFNLNNPPKYIKKAVETIEIKTESKKLLILKLDDFLLDFKELKKINASITELNKRFKEATFNSTINS